MASGHNTKRQHFIPRFLLSQFADPSSGCIHIYDFDRATTLPAQKPRTAFAKRFYYDNDNEVEDFLAAGIEGPAAPVIRHLLEVGAGINDRARVALVKFVGAQIGRTPAARTEVESLVKGSLDLLIRQLLVANGYSEEDAHGVHLENNNPRALHAWRIAHASLSAFLFLDLEIAILENKTGTPFVLGDHPVIQYNWP